MKRTVGYMLFLIASIVMSCSNDSAPAPSSLPNSPEAQAADDAKSGGIYKGAILGSTGSFVVVLQKGVTAVNITLDGVSKSLSTTVLTSWTSGQPIKNALFTSGDWQATFSVGATGLTPSLTLSIPSHADPKVIITKEVSTAIVRVFEGTFVGTESGTWNFTVQGPALSGASRLASGATTVEFSGLVDGNTIIFDNINGTGTFSGDTASGTWQGSSPSSSGTWTGKRTL